MIFNLFLSDEEILRFNLSDEEISTFLSAIFNLFLSDEDNLFLSEDF